MPRKILVLCLMIMAILALSVPGFSENSTILLKAATVKSADSTEAVVLSTFKELVEKRTQGHIKIGIYTDGALGNDEQLIKGLQRGTVDLATCASFKYADYIPELMTLELPFLFFSTEHLRQTLNGTLGEVLAEQAIKTRGDTVLGYITSNPVNVISSKTIPNLSRSQSLRFRTMLLPTHRQTWERLGMLPVTLAYSELRIGLQVGLVELTEMSFGEFKQMRIYETAKFILQTEHYFPVSPLLLSKIALDKIPQSYRALLRDCAREAIDDGTDYMSLTNNEIARELTGKYWVRISEFSFADKKACRSKVADEQQKVFSGFGLEKVWTEINRTFDQYEPLPELEEEPEP